MNLKDYISGEYRQEYQYKSFIPSSINHGAVENLVYEKIRDKHDKQ
jgi:hypothetical protein